MLQRLTEEVEVIDAGSLRARALEKELVQAEVLGKFHEPGAIRGYHVTAGIVLPQPEPAQIIPEIVERDPTLTPKLESILHLPPREPAHPCRHTSSVA